MKVDCIESFSNNILSSKGDHVIEFHEIFAMSINKAPTGWKELGFVKAHKY